MKKILAFLIVLLFTNFVYAELSYFPKDFDYSFESKDSNINLDLSIIKSDFCENLKNFKINVDIFKYEQKNILNTFDFINNIYLSHLEKQEQAAIFFELMVSHTLINYKLELLSKCKFSKEISSINYDKFYYNWFENMEKTMTSLDELMNENINYLQKIYLSLSDKVLEVMIIDPTFSDFQIESIKLIINNRKNENYKFIIDWGEYYALMIGNDDYQDEMLVDLDSPINDVSLLSDTLISKYRFKKENIKILKNATRADILDTLFEYRELDKYNNNKNLLIYYAGHGEIDRIDENTIQGYWLPSDAHYQKKSSWIPNNRIREELKALPFKHIIIIADSCFSGTWTAFKSSVKKIPIDIEARKRFLENKNSLYARVALTSGNIDEVPDTIDSNVNSQFSIALNNALLKNDDILLSSKLHDDIINEIQYSGYLQDPTYGGIVNAKHSPGGNFIFAPSD